MTEDLENKLGRYLSDQGLTLALAESCTGGLIGDRITNTPGSSGYFLGGVVAYSYQAKVDLLGVSWDTLNKYGAVSSEVVLEMANGIRAALGSDLATAVSGIAGPGGGTPEKPVGLVWIALVGQEHSWVRKFQFSGNRVEIKSASADAALQFVLDFLEDRL